jgi:hypothetical protein
VRPRPLPRLAPQLGSRHWRLGTLPHRTYLVPSPLVPTSYPPPSH